jgi:hypothetical protein
MSQVDDPLYELFENISSKADFLNFVQALSDDKLDEVEKEKLSPSPSYGSGANGWENGSIENFLNAVSRYGQDNELISENPNWKDFALLLYAGKFYE